MICIGGSVSLLRLRSPLYLACLLLLLLFLSPARYSFLTSLWSQFVFPPPPPGFGSSFINSFSRQLTPV